MLQLKAVHHIAIICSDHLRSKHFYTDILGFHCINEVYREERKSWKIDLALNNQYILELFSFPNPPQRASMPEACGLRHIAFTVANIEQAISQLKEKSVTVEPIRVDEYTGKCFTFFMDPDGLPIELYEE